MVGEKRKVKERRGFFFSFYAHVFFLLDSQTPIKDSGSYLPSSGKKRKKKKRE